MLIRINNDLRPRQLLAGQVMISHQHTDTQILSGRHALDAGDTVVDSDNQVRCLRGRQIDNFRGQAVAKLEAIGHQIPNLPQTHLPQHRYRHGATGRAVGVEVSDDEHASVAFNCVSE